MAKIVFGWTAGITDQLLAMATLVFLAAATRARIVAPDLIGVPLL
jgi:hypothetical protein